MVRAGTYGFGVNLLWIAYLIVGVVVAGDRNYFKGVNMLEEVVEAGLAIILWPLVLADVSVRI